MRFSDLLDDDRYDELGLYGPARVQLEARRRFPEVVRAHGLRLADVPPTPAYSGTYVLIAVAAGYDRRGLAVLDGIADAVRSRADEVAELIDISGEVAGHALARLVPRSMDAAQTPVVAIWTNGELGTVQLGKAARDFLRMRYRGRSAD